MATEKAKAPEKAKRGRLESRVLDEKAKHPTPGGQINLSTLNEKLKTSGQPEAIQEAILSGLHRWKKS